LACGDHRPSGFFGDVDELRDGRSPAMAGVDRVGKVMV